MSIIAQSATPTGSSVAACVGHGDLFLDELIETPASKLTMIESRRQSKMLDAAAKLCAGCPLQNDCLYDAVIRYDVAGYVAGTTPKQRSAMRIRLRWTVKPESFDGFLGLGSGGQIDRNELLRLRRNNPQQTLESLADQLHCSVSTIKRHLKLARDGEPTEPVLTPIAPSMEQVLAARDDVLSNTQRHTRLAVAA
jgi:hypothetical protein